MLINVNTSTGAVSAINTGESDEVLQICDRLREELEGWLNYHQLKRTHGKRYEAIAGQEFQHALVALGDLLNKLPDRLTEAEGEEFKKFRTECFDK